MRAVASSVVQLVGAAAVFYGLWLVWEPLMWLASGSVLLALGYALSVERPISAPVRRRPGRVRTVFDQARTGAGERVDAARQWLRRAWRRVRG